MLKAIPTKCSWNNYQVKTPHSTPYWQLAVLYFLTYFFKFSNYELPALLSELNVRGPTSMSYLPGTFCLNFLFLHGVALLPPFSSAPLLYLPRP